MRSAGPQLMPPLITIAILGVLFLALLWLFQRRLIYLPFGEVPAAADVLPGSREVEILTRDGFTLRAWMIAPRDPAPWAAVLVLPGNAGNRAYRAPLAAALSEAGLAVLLLDYRGYGGNPGRPTEGGLLSDARAAAAFLLEDTGLADERLVLFGESLGTGVAVALARERAVGALVLRSPFTSLTDVGRLHYPFLPVRLLLRDRYESIGGIANAGAPVLVVAGEQDRIIPAKLSRKLFDAAREPKRFRLLAGADHNDWELLAGDELIEEVVGFVASALNASTDRTPRAFPPSPDL